MSFVTMIGLWILSECFQVTTNPINRSST